MTLAFSADLVATIVLVVAVAGAVNGVAGFGFAVVGTMVLATTLDPATAKREAEERAREAVERAS